MNQIFDQWVLAGGLVHQHHLYQCVLRLKTPIHSARRYMPPCASKFLFIKKLLAVERTSATNLCIDDVKVNPLYGPAGMAFAFQLDALSAVNIVKTKAGGVVWLLLECLSVGKNLLF